MSPGKLVRSWEQKSEKMEFFSLGKSGEKGTMAKMFKLIQQRKEFILREDGTRGRFKFQQEILSLNRFF